MLDRLVQTPFLPESIRVHGNGPFHVEKPGSAVIICDNQGYNRVCFFPSEGITFLFQSEEHNKLCDDICGFLNEEADPS